MVSKCPKCGRTAPEDSIYCPYCAYGLKPSARTTRVSVGGALMIVAAVGSFILFVLSIRALLDIYRWYPRLVAQSWFVYDQLLTVFSFAGLLFGVPAAILSLNRRSYKWTMILAILCTLSGGGAWVTSMIIPSLKIKDLLWYSIFYFFLPVFFPPLLGTMLIYPRKEEFKQ